MKKMRKIFAVLLTLAMVLGMSMTSFAADAKATITLKNFDTANKVEYMQIIQNDETKVSGGSLLLIPLAWKRFWIPNDVAMQVVAVGFIIGVLQDSCETALNSSTDALFTAAACMAEDDQLAKNALRG